MTFQRWRSQVINISIPHWNLTQLAQAVVPLAFGIWLYRHASKNRSNELSVQELPPL
jgi:hypothetical protein